MTEIDHHGTRLLLLPERAVLHEESGTLFVCDLHLGKAGAFRDSGIPLPDGGDADTLRRLGALAGRAGVRSVLVLGDLFHARSPGSMAAAGMLRLFMQGYDGISWRLVPGNHDTGIHWPRTVPGLEILPEGTLAHGLRLTHFPPDHSDIPALSGHLHPGLEVGPRGRRKQVLPCFWMHQGVLVLPAFGAITGLKKVSRCAHDRAWVALPDRVVEVPGSPPACAPA